MTRIGILVLATCLLLASHTIAGEIALVRLGGTPVEVGHTWGAMNKQAILRDIGSQYLKKGAEAGLSEEELIERGKPFARIVANIAPHWLEESKAIARAAGIREDLYISYLGNRPRNLFLHECTSYSVSRDHTQGNAILFHKTRDNEAREQAAFVLDSDVPGINKFIAVCDASAITCCMMVNDKGLAGSADYPVNLTRKGDPSALRPDEADPQYRGLMNGSILRYIAERASTCAEALAILEEFVEKRYYAGGTVNGTHWLFVDRKGVILEVSNTARQVLSRIHSQEKVYFSRLDESAAARRLREAASPIGFHLFHNVSRDPSICFRPSSVSGMTVEIDANHPETFTCAWISLPAQSVSFPLLMAQTKTPACLLDGTAYTLGIKTQGTTERWEALEKAAHQSKDLVTKAMKAEGPKQAAAVAERWSQRQAERLVKVLQE